VLLTLSAAFPLFAQSETLTAVPTHDAKVVKRWALAGDPHGVAIGADGTLYVGLAQPQAVVAIDAKTGAVKKKVVLDSAEIASTKELVTLRINRDGSRLFIANGSDESATILSLPDLGVVREITIEGEPIRDALPDPRGRYLYLLGRRVHVYDAGGERELHALDVGDPMAIAANGKMLAVIAAEGTVFFDTNTFTEKARAPLNTDAPVDAALFATNGALVTLGRTAMSVATGKAHPICLPDGSGPQIAALAPNDVLLFAERRCDASAPDGGGRVTPVSLYGVSAYALAFDRAANALVTTERAGYLTIYKVPRVPVLH
jgi:DNA-binding beta-propeller fold protein YncE